MGTADEQITPTAAGIYDAVLGGTYNTAADRAYASKLCEIEPLIPEMAWANRGFLQRVVHWLVSEAGIDQIVDIGSGLPTVQNTHDIAGPDCRVVYVDHDPEVVRQSTAILENVPNASCLQWDVTAPGLLDNAHLRSVIDFGRPVGLLIVGVMYFVSDETKPHEAARRLIAGLPEGSYFALSHLISDRQNEQNIERAKAVYANARQQLHFRTFAQVREFFTGTEIVPPYPGAEAKLDYIGLWGADNPSEADDDSSRWFAAGVGKITNADHSG